MTHDERRQLADIRAHLAVQAEAMARLIAASRLDDDAWTTALDPSRSFLNPDLDLKGSAAGTSDMRARVEAATRFLQVARSRGG